MLLNSEITLPGLPCGWNYEESVNRIRPNIYKWKNLTIEVAQELYIAREMLASQGTRTDLGTNIPKLTWGGYCKDIGIEKRTANRWLEQFFPSKHEPPLQIEHTEMCAVSDLYELIKAGKKYKTVLADPPWAYSNQATRAATDNHYNTLSIEEICQLPVARLADESAHLHLWTTNAFLFESKQVMESWGFEYKSVFLWIKPSMGIGNYWRVSHEFMLLGTKGSLPFNDHSEMSWYSEKRSRHSRKPYGIVHKIEKVSPGPYLELFGRETRKGWTVWGNEIEKTLFNEGAFNGKER
jgi:N6-adenosine-specific RNA methylase IME4